MAAAEVIKTVPVNMEALFQSIVDYTSYPQFVTGVKAVSIEEQLPNGAKIVKMNMELLKAISYTLNIQEKLEPRSSASVLWTLAQSDFLKSNVGGWQLKYLGPATTEVTYRLDLEFLIPVPGFILKNLVKSSLPKAVDEMVERARLRG